MILVASTAKLFIGSAARLAKLAARWHSRRQAALFLEASPDTMLKDIGIARSEIHHVTRFGRASNASVRWEGYGHVGS
jgi:uncharacterized protein YjiS (DUF1127 family)